MNDLTQPDGWFAIAALAIRHTGKGTTLQNCASYCRGSAQEAEGKGYRILRERFSIDDGWLHYVTIIRIEEILQDEEIQPIARQRRFNLRRTLTGAT